MGYASYFESLYLLTLAASDCEPAYKGRLANGFISGCNSLQSFERIIHIVD